MSSRVLRALIVPVALFAAVLTARPAAAADAGEAAAPAAAAPEEDKPSGWIFDGDIGLPQLKSDETSVAFDVNAGYLGRHWGFGAYLSSYTYALKQDDSLNQTVRQRFGLDARYLSGSKDDDVRYEGKVELNSGGFNTTYIGLGDTTNFKSETSVLSRMTFLVGRRAKVSEALRYKLSVGAGFQGEAYSNSSDGGGDDGGSSENSFSVSTRLVARAQVAHQTLPGTLALRGEVEGTTFEMRRFAFFAGGEQTDADAQTVTEFRQIDARVRVFGDIEKLAFAGLMPSAFVGLDFVRVSGDDRTSSAFVPIFGVGLINVTPKD